MEAVHWEPPLLSFTIERHGAMALGSTRAELQRWRVDLRRLQASCIKDRGYRQLRQRAEPVKTEPMAAELVEAISEGRAGDRLKWGHDGTVRVVLTKVFPYGSGYMQTIAGRRNGFARRSPSFWQRAAGATFTPEKLRPGSEAKLVLSEGRVGWSYAEAGQALER
jgi:hypothetical protein